MLSTQMHTKKYSPIGLHFSVSLCKVYKGIHLKISSKMLIIASIASLPAAQIQSEF